MAGSGRMGQASLGDAKETLISPSCPSEIILSYRDF